MSESGIVIKIKFKDRLGLGYEILEIFKNNKINLLALEAKVNQSMMIKIQQIASEKLSAIIKELKKVADVKFVAIKEQMPYEQREQQLKTILNLVSEGIIAINGNSEITHINNVAAKILHIPQNNSIGKKINDLFDDSVPFLKTLQDGRMYHLKEMKLIKQNKQFHYLTSGSPIVNDKGKIIGAVVTIKDFKQVKEIVSKVGANKKTISFNDIIYQSENMKKVVDTAKMVAKGDSSILLRGESGTGKEFFARAIHMESNRAPSPFIAVNCAALPESLLESELFGYEEGAFTGAARGGKKGLFEQAETGTLFLDEVAEISLQMQVQLLRVLQENTIRKISGNEEISIDVRIIAATNRNLEEMIDRGLFREDLYYRLNVIPLIIPPLRQRTEDIPLIAQHLVRKIALKLSKPEVHLTKDALEYLLNHHWPGNVRQLENTLERILNVTDETEINRSHFDDWTSDELIKQEQIDKKNKTQIIIPLEENVSTLKEIVGEAEKHALIQVLNKHPSSRKAGSVLGVSNTTILNKMKRYGIKLSYQLED